MTPDETPSVWATILATVPPGPLADRIRARSGGALAPDDYTEDGVDAIVDALAWVRLSTTGGVLSARAGKTIEGLLVSAGERLVQHEPAIRGQRS